MVDDIKVFTCSSVRRNELTELSRRFSMLMLISRRMPFSRPLIVKPLYPSSLLTSIYFSRELGNMKSEGV